VANRLRFEKSPYLLQHANNPVDWYSWGDDALERARAEDKPILVSIGYSACHWCHVMEHESFEDENVARLMNDWFINVKVDREERPDVDAIYMEAVQALSGHGGWPLNCFLTPEGKPFYGGTYFPVTSHHGLPSWTEVLHAVAEAYRSRRDDVDKSADALTEAISRAQGVQRTTQDWDPDILVAAYGQAMAQCDWKHGGFGGAPKFPQPVVLDWILRVWKRTGDERALEFLHLTLGRMAQSGIFDQLAGGFHRYTVDAEWVVPHFEKMLYDNALLVRVYLQMYQATARELYRDVVERTLDYLIRDMQSTEGGFYSAQDADSEGEEGKYYVWTPWELRELLSPLDYETATSFFGVTPGGNFEGRTILTVSESAEDVARAQRRATADVEGDVRRIRAILLESRSKRVAPSTDTKQLTAWNALAIRALCEAGRVLQRQDYLDIAAATALFVQNHLMSDGRLLRSYKDGAGHIEGFLEDYAFMLEAELSLYETTGRVTYLERATELSAQLTDLFWDGPQQAFFDTSMQSTALVVRPRGMFDNPIPSGNASAAFGLLRLEQLTGERRVIDPAVAVMRSVADMVVRAPLAFGYLLGSMEFYIASPIEIALVGDPETPGLHALRDLVWSKYLPNKVVAMGEPDASPLLQNRPVLDGKGTAYLCRNFTCRRPTNDLDEFAAQLQEA